MRTRLALLLAVSLAATLGATAASGSRVEIARAANGEPPRVAWLTEAGGPGDPEAFRKALRAGERTRQVVLDVHEAAYGQDLRSAAAALARARPALFVAVGLPAIQAAREVADGRPVVMLMVGRDPVEARVIDGYSRPGGNVTGVMVLSHEHVGKRLELLRRAVPGLRRVAMLVEAGDEDGALQAREGRKAALANGVEFMVVEAREAADHERILATLARARTDGVLVADSPLLFRDARRIADLAVKYRLPVMYERREIVKDGGLMSYGPDETAIHRRLATYVDKILQGARPQDLAVAQPTAFEFVINLRAAAAIRLAIPQSLLLRADDVIR